MKLLKDLLVDSYSGEYSKIAKVIVQYLKKNTNAKIILQKFGKKKNVIAIFGKPSLLINCHMDTVVPVGKWNTNPLKLTEKNGKMYGLGTCDVKGSLYCLLKAVANKKPKNLMLLFSFDEETGSVESGVTYFLKSKYYKGIKKAIVCEPTELKIINKHKGYYSFIIKVMTKPGHSSGNLKDSAITKSAKMILDLSKEGFNIGKVEGGSKGNIVAHSCEFKISIRSYDGVLDVVKKIKKICKNATIKKHFIGPSLNKKGSEVNFWTEAALFDQKGINSVVFGVGSIKQAHKNNEFVEKKDLIKGIKDFEALI
jgi:acetylornithine deacetylase